MSDLRFGCSETNIRMVRTFAFFFGSGQYYMYIVMHVPERTFIILALFPLMLRRNETPCDLGKFIYIHKSNKNHAKTASLICHYQKCTTCASENKFNFVTVLWYSEFVSEFVSSLHKRVSLRIHVLRSYLCFLVCSPSK